MPDDEPIELNDLAVAEVASRKLLVMLASLLVGAGALTLDDLQDCLMEEAKEQRQHPPLGERIAIELEGLAKLFDPSVLPLEPRPDPGSSNSRPPRGRSAGRRRTGRR